MTYKIKHVLYSNLIENCRLRSDVISYAGKYIVLTQMQDDSNPWQPPKWNKGKCIFPNLKRQPKNKMSAKKIFYYWFWAFNTQSMSGSIYLYQSVSLSPSSKSVPSSSSSHSLPTFPSSSLSFHYIPSSVTSIALDVQHFLQPFTITSSDMCYHTITIHSYERILLYSLVYKLTWTHKDS